MRHQQGPLAEFWLELGPGGRRLEVECLRPWLDLVRLQGDLPRHWWYYRVLLQDHLLLRHMQLLKELGRHTHMLWRLRLHMWLRQRPWLHVWLRQKAWLHLWLGHMRLWPWLHVWLRQRPWLHLWLGHMRLWPWLHLCLWWLRMWPRQRPWQWYLRLRLGCGPCHFV